MHHTTASEGFTQAWDTLVLWQSKQVTANHPRHLRYTTRAWRKFPLGLILLLGFEIPAKSSVLTQLWLFQVGEWAQKARALWIPALLLPGNGLWFGFKGSVHFPGNPERVFCAGTVYGSSETHRTCCSLQGVSAHISKNYVRSSWVPHQHIYLFLLEKNKTKQNIFLPVQHIMEHMSHSQAFYQRKLKSRASEAGVSKRGHKRHMPEACQKYQSHDCKDDNKTKKCHLTARSALLFFFFHKNKKTL